MCFGGSISVNTCDVCQAQKSCANGCFHNFQGGGGGCVGGGGVGWGPFL